MCIGTHPFIPAPGVINVQVVFDVLGQKCQNVYNVLSGAGTGVADMNRIGAKVEDWLRTQWAQGASNQVTPFVISMTDAGVDGGLGVERTPAPVIWGNINQPPMPTNVTFAVKWSTGFTGRSNRGRSFYVGICPVSVTGNQLGASGVPAFLALHTQLLTMLHAGGTDDKLVVVSYCHDNAWLPTAGIKEILSCSIDVNLDSMRRRLAGRGT